jgi:hypothetical protein
MLKSGVIATLHANSSRGMGGVWATWKQDDRQIASKGMSSQVRMMCEGNPIFISNNPLYSHVLNSKTNLIQYIIPVVTEEFQTYVSCQQVSIWVECQKEYKQRSWNHQRKIKRRVEGIPTVICSHLLIDIFHLPDIQ